MPNNDGFDDEFTNILDDEQEDEYEDTVEEDEDYGNLDEDFGDPENEEYEDDVEETEEIEETESPDTEDTPEQSSSSDNVRIENFYKGIDWNSYKKSYGDRVSYFRLLCLMGYRVALKNMKDMYEVMTDTALDFSLSLCRENNIPAANDELSTAYMKAVAELFSETSNTKIKVMEDLEQRCLNDDSFAMVTVHNGDNAVGDERHFTVYILILVYLVSAMGILTSDDIIVTDSGKIGFKGSLGEEGVLSECLKNQLRDKRLSKYESYIPSSLKLAIEQNLNLKLSDGSIEEYFKNKVYVADERVIQDVVEPPDTEDAEIRRIIVSRTENLIRNISETINKIYAALFSSCYQVVKATGVFTPDGIITIKNGKLEYIKSRAACRIGAILTNRLGFSTQYDAEFNIDKIVDAYKSSQKTILYFPVKLCEYALGLVNNQGSYNSAGEFAQSWSSYYINLIARPLKKLLRLLTFAHYKSEGCYSLKKCTDEKCINSLRGFLVYVTQCLTSCVMATNWRVLQYKDEDGYIIDNYLGFKVRVSDNVIKLSRSQFVIKHTIDLKTDELTQTIIADAFDGYTGDATAIIEKPTFVGTDKDVYYAVDIQHRFRAKILDAEPLFAFKALRALKASGVTPSWDALPFAKCDDDSVMMFGTLEEVSKSLKSGNQTAKDLGVNIVNMNKVIDLRTNLVHWVIAGSRAGKGVMTLNPTSGAIVSGRALFYVDSKPDMSSIFRYLSNGKMFCVNGQYGEEYDCKRCCSASDFKADSPKFYPEYLRAVLGEACGVVQGSIIYLRAVLFLISLIYVRGNISKEKFELLGGDNGIVIILDEFTRIFQQWNIELGSKNGKLNSAYCSKDFISKAKKKIAEGKGNSEEITEFECWVTDFYNNINETIAEFNSWAKAGLVGHLRFNTDIFIIGQELQKASIDELQYNGVASGKGIKNGGDDSFNPIYNLFCKQPSDGFFGFNDEQPSYMCTSKEDAKNKVKAALRLTGTARNFAYIDDLSANMITTISDGNAKSSREISDSGVYVKPFLIFNEGEENSYCIRHDFKIACEKNELDFDEMLDLNRVQNPDGSIMDANGNKNPLEPAIGYEAYINELGGGNVNIAEALSKSWHIANALVKAFRPDYDGDCVDFIYDLRPESMFTATALAEAFNKDRGGIRCCKTWDTFFGNTDTGFSSDEIDNMSEDAETTKQSEYSRFWREARRGTAAENTGTVQPIQQTTQSNTQTTQSNTQTTQPTPQATQPNTQPTDKPTREQVIDYYIQKATDMLLPRFESIMAQNQALADLLRSNDMTMEALLKQVCTPFATKRYESVGDMYYGR